MDPHLHPDEYQRLHASARRRALQLRQEAIRDSQVWLVCAFVRAVRRLAHRTQTAITPTPPPPNELKTPCRPTV